MAARRSAFRNASLFALVMWVTATLPASAQTVLTGKVIDALTERAINGAQVVVRHGNAELGQVTTDVGGRYTLPLTTTGLPSPVDLVANVEHAGYAAAATVFQIADGSITANAVNLALVPTEISACRSDHRHAVIVGYFRSSANRALDDLPGRVADLLYFNLTTRLQSVHLEQDLQPVFEACEYAKPRSVAHGDRYARALAADAFVSGDVVEQPSSYSVSTYVSDAHALFGRPAVSQSEDVDLNRPAYGVMSGDTHAAVLAAIAAGLAKADNCLAAVKVIQAAEAMTQSDLAYLAALRQKCQEALPHAGLLGGS